MEFAAGAAAGAAAAGAAAGALDAGFAGAAMVFDDAGALEAAAASAFLLFLDFFAVVAEVSLLAAVLSVAAALSSAAAASFLLFFDFFLVVVVLLSVVLVVLVWAAANTGIKAMLNTKDKIAVHRVNLFREFIIFLISSHVRGVTPRIFRSLSLNLCCTKRLRWNPRNITSWGPMGQPKVGASPAGKPQKSTIYG